MTTWQDIGTEGWDVHQPGQDPHLDEIVSRRFGSRHEKPCDDPNVLTCTSPPCQAANKCVRSCPSPPKEGE